MATQETAPATTVAPAPSPVEAVPNDQAPVADDSLSKALAARAEYLSSSKPAPAADAEQAVAAKEATTEVESKVAKPTDGQQTLADPAKAESPKDAVAAKDAVADELAKIARAAQAAAHRQRDLDTREAAIKTKADAIARAEALEAAAKTDPLKAIELLLGPEALTGNLPFQLIDAAVARQQGKPELTQEEQEAALIARAKAAAIKELEAKQAEEARKQASELAARREANKATYFSQLDAYTKANASKYQLVAAEGVDVADVEKFVDTHYDATGKLATADEVLAHFEAQLEGRAARLAAIIAKRNVTPAQAKVAISPSVPAEKPAVDTRGRAPLPKRKSFEDDRQARMAALDRK